jgi:predicted nucleic-acid-binding Zn-ribbon protein
MPAIEVSCPSCGKENIIEMKIHEAMKGSMEEMFTLIEVKNYSFTGEGCCAQCGKMVDVILTVGNSPKGGNTHGI